MGVPARHILSQGPVLGALGRTAYLALRQRMTQNGAAAPALHTPGPEIERSAPPLPRALIDDYVRYLGGDARAYRGEVPAHLFPQWCMPALARTLEGLPYPLLRVLNGGCRVRVKAKLPDNEPLVVRARLEDVDDNGSRAVLHQRVVSGTRNVPDALEIDFYAIVPLASGKSGNGKTNGKSNGAGRPQPKDRPRVAQDAREVQRTRLRADAGLGFAKLTGDFNPIHWVRAYARASGFPSVILHGFGTFAFAWEGLNKSVFGGDVHAIDTFDVKFAKPLVLPHEIGLYVHDRQVFVGDAPGGPAYLTGTFSANHSRGNR
jgi:hypothetical protein